MKAINTLGYECINCGKEFNFSETLYTCDNCNNNLQIIYDYNYIKNNWTKENLLSNKDYTMWRYHPIYPTKSKINYPCVGWTPLYKTDKLGQLIGLKNLYLKDEGKNPSASFKDRASSIVLARGLDKNINLITGASTGNAASSMACLSANLGIKNIIFVPKSAPIAKITQLLIFGAKVISVNGTYDNAFDLCLKASERFGWYNRNTGFNPFTREGKKSSALEICEQLNWDVPDYVFVSVGDGNIISGLWKGFSDLYKIGFIQKLPKMVACQAENSNAIQLAFDNNATIKPVSGCTVADSISVSIPRDALAAIKALKESSGLAISVSDDEILNAIKIVAQNTGVFGEPAGVTSFAALNKALEKQIIKSEDKIVFIITGNGLKDINSAMKTVKEPLQIEPDITELEKLYKYIFS